MTHTRRACPRRTLEIRRARITWFLFAVAGTTGGCDCLLERFARLTPGLPEIPEIPDLPDVTGDYPLDELESLDTNASFEDASGDEEDASADEGDEDGGDGGDDSGDSGDSGDSADSGDSWDGADSDDGGDDGPWTEDDAGDGGDGGDACDPPRIHCEAGCIDPDRSWLHCGAEGDCEGDAAGRRCATDEVCDQGRCRGVEGGWSEAGSDELDVELAQLEGVGLTEDTAVLLARSSGDLVPLFDDGEGFVRIGPAWPQPSPIDAVRSTLEDDTSALFVWQAGGNWSWNRFDPVRADWRHGTGRDAAIDSFGRTGAASLRSIDGGHDAILVWQERDPAGDGTRLRSAWLHDEHWQTDSVLATTTGPHDSTPMFSTSTAPGHPMLAHTRDGRVLEYRSWTGDSWGPPAVVVSVEEGTRIEGPSLETSAGFVALTWTERHEDDSLASMHYGLYDGESWQLGTLPLDVEVVDHAQLQADVGTDPSALHLFVPARSDFGEVNHSAWIEQRFGILDLQDTGGFVGTLRHPSSSIARSRGRHGHALQATVSEDSPAGTRRCHLWQHLAGPQLWQLIDSQVCEHSRLHHAPAGHGLYAWTTAENRRIVHHRHYTPHRR